MFTNYDSFFKELRSIKQKQIRTEHHVSNLCSYMYNNKVPQGLQIKLTPQTPGVKSQRFHQRWNDILFDCSMRLMELLYHHGQHQNDSLYNEYTSLLNHCKESLPVEEFTEINSRLTDITCIQSNKLANKQVKKFQRDGVNKISTPVSSSHTTKRKRKRRFRRRKPITKDTCNIVVNLSSKDLTDAETSLLSKGLNFCPNPSKINEHELSEDLNQFSRRLRIKEYFHAKEKNGDNEVETSVSDGTEEELPIINRFKKKSDWIPKPSKNTTLESVINLIKSNVTNSANTNTHQHDNLSKEERSALYSLKERDDIVIKPADKGSAVVVMDKSDYIQEAERQLSDNRFYKKLDSDPTVDFTQKITKSLEDMHDKGYIDFDTLEYLKPEEAKAGRFYLLPKIHKENNPGRPIVSANGHPTEKLSEFVDFHLRPFVENLPSHIKDTTDYLKKMENMNPLPTNTLLVSMDVTSLYTNIPHDDGIAACREIWDRRSVQEPPTECLVEMLTLVLKHNNFTFNGEHYLQVNGTAMGTKMAPSYANIFMGKLEKQILETAEKQPLSWFRFIDDVDMKWTETEEQLDKFMQHANSAHPSIKFTHEISRTKITFLDTTTIIKDGIMSTDIYSKPTDKHQYLSPSSCHPSHCYKSIPYSQAIRVKRICSTDEKASQRLGELRCHLKKRGYNNKSIQKGFEKAKSVPRKELLEYKVKKTNNRIPFVVTYHPALQNVSSTIREHWKEFEKHPELNKLFPEPPVMAFRRPKSLRDILVRADITKQLCTQSGQCRACEVPRCKSCRQMSNTKTFKSNTTGKEYTIFGNLTCKTENTVYILECTVCPLQYVGESIQQFNKRMNGHRSDLDRKTFLPVSQHFLSSPDHSKKDFKKMKITLIDHNPNWSYSQRKERESYWIKELGTLHPKGINKKE